MTNCPEGYEYKRKTLCENLRNCQAVKYCSGTVDCILDANECYDGDKRYSCIGCFMIPFRP